MTGGLTSTVTSRVNTSIAGRQFVRMTTSDKVANTKVLSGVDGPSPGCEVTVAYRFDGFREPISADALNNVKAGSTIPVKWRITDANGVGISDPASLASLRFVAESCDATVPMESVDEVLATTGLKNLGDGTWQYNWKSPKTWRNCFELQLTLADGTPMHTAPVFFR